MVSTFEGWTEGMIFSVLFVIIFGGIIVVGMNSLHDGDYVIEGLNTSTMESAFETTQESVHSNIEGGDASFTSSSSGLTLGSSWDIIKSILAMVMFFITGGWIQTSIMYMGLPEILGWGFRGLYIITMGFIILRILFKDRI